MTIRAILDDLGIDYEIIGDEAKACCPSHDDTHPSWYCNLVSGIHHCFACHFKGSLQTLVQKRLNCSLPEAIQYCYARQGLSKAHEWLKEPKDTRPAIEVTESELALFTDPPLEALEQKNITLEAARHFGVLWNPITNAWILPVRDPFTSKLWGWQEKDGRHFRNYPRGLHKSRTLFGLSAFEYDSPIVLVESPIDTVRLFSAGRRGGVSSFGVSVSDKQFSLIHRFSPLLICAFDNDSAGVGETARVCREFKQVPVSVFNYGYVKTGNRYKIDVIKGTGKDPGELSDDQIAFGLDHAINRSLARFSTTKQDKTFSQENYTDTKKSQ